jgi:hypothetical protein
MASHRYNKVYSYINFRCRVVFCSWVTLLYYTHDELISISNMICYVLINKTSVYLNVISIDKRGGMDQTNIHTQINSLIKNITKRIEKLLIIRLL